MAGSFHAIVFYRGYYLRGMLFPWIQIVLNLKCTFPKARILMAPAAKSAMARWKSSGVDFRRCAIDIVFNEFRIAPARWSQHMHLKHCLPAPQNKMFHVWGMVVRQSYSRRHMIECRYALQPCNVTFEFCPQQFFHVWEIQTSQTRG